MKPAGADLWVTSLPELGGKPIATFCTYAFNPRRSLDMLGELLTRRGGHVIAQQWHGHSASCSRSTARSNATDDSYTAQGAVLRSDAPR